MFRDLLQGLVSDVAFNAIGDIAETVEFVHSEKKSHYDTATGKKAEPIGESRIAVRAVVQPRSRNKGGYDQMSRREVAGTHEALIPARDFTVRPPATNDKLVRQNESYVVRGIEIDAAGAMWTLDIERIGGSTRDDVS